MINGNTLLALGWPSAPVVGAGLKAARRLVKADVAEDLIIERLEGVRQQPEGWLEDDLLGTLAEEWLRLNKRARLAEANKLRDEPIEIAAWGAEMIDSGALEQMENAARLPIARAAAVMPDSHVGYGLPIGGVLAVENAVIPYAVGVDIACRMRLSVFDAQPYLLEKKSRKFERALVNQTRFGMGVQWEDELRPEHEVMDDAAWEQLPLLRRLKDKGWAQLGTSGGGNHFVEFGTLVLDEDAPDLGLAAGKYLALLSHSGSRGAGARIANNYSKIARKLHPNLNKKVKHLAWLEMDSEEGLEYWLAMNLAGRYASANHAVIHERVAHAARLTAIATVENHHNFAWQETLADGTAVIVHRKGATPAGEGVLGVIPGSMADPGYVVRGKGNLASINSAAHGAGRRFSRREAFKRVDPKVWEKYLHERRVTLFGGSLDESPQAYKSIQKVMNAQADLVEIVARFEPRLVRMADG
jgi:tRNA-splicing ligase RtcB